MKDMKKTQDKRLVLLEAIIRYADLSDDINPYFYKDEMLKRLDVCEHVFNIMLIQLGEKYCRITDGFEERVRYTVNVTGCLELRNQIIEANTRERRHREGRIKLLEALIATFFLILFGSWII
jgi:hypothetical protein